MNTAPIPEHYRKDGFDFHLERFEAVESLKWIIAVYRQEKRGGVVGYEVIRARYKKQRTTPYGIVYPAGYKLPNTERWGTDGWTYFSAEEALQRYDDLLANGGRVEKQAPAVRVVSGMGQVTQSHVSHREDRRIRGLVQTSETTA